MGEEVVDSVKPTPEVVDATVTPSKADKAKALLKSLVEKSKVVGDQSVAYLRDYAYEVFLVAILIAVSAFVLLFPKVALGVGGIVAAVSGWVAYIGLRKRCGGGSCCKTSECCKGTECPKE